MASSVASRTYTAALGCWRRGPRSPWLGLAGLGFGRQSLMRGWYRRRRGGWWLRRWRRRWLAGVDTCESNASFSFVGRCSPSTIP